MRRGELDLRGQRQEELAHVHVGERASRAHATPFLKDILCLFTDPGAAEQRQLVLRPPAPRGHGEPSVDRSEAPFVDPRRGGNGGGPHLGPRGLEPRGSDPDRRLSDQGSRPAPQRALLRDLVTNGRPATPQEQVRQELIAARHHPLHQLAGQGRPVPERAGSLVVLSRLAEEVAGDGAVQDCTEVLHPVQGSRALLIGRDGHPEERSDLLDVLRLVDLRELRIHDRQGRQRTPGEGEVFGGRVGGDHRGVDPPTTRRRLRP